jgi:hypothetical protein
MPLPTTFAGDASRAEGQFTTIGSAAQVYTMQSWQDTMNFVSGTSSIGPMNAVYSIAVDASGNVYSIGQANTGNGGTYSLILNKQSSSGALLWSKGLSTVNGYRTTFLFNGLFEINVGLTLDSSGNVYVFGAPSGYGSQIIKFNSSGTILWAYHLTGGTNPQPDTNSFFVSITVDSSGNVYAVGNNGASSPMVVKINSSGVWQWGYYLSSPTTSNNSYGGIKVDSSGNVNVAIGNVMFQLNSSGALNWFSNPSPTPTFSNVVVDGSNNIYVFGYDSTNVQIIYSYTSSGTVRWGRRYTNASFAAGTLVGATIDSSNNIYAIGLLGPSVGIDRPSIGSTLKIDSNGNVLNSGSFYSPQRGSTPAYDTAGYCCAVDSSGNTYWGGEAQTSQYYVNKSINYYLNNALVVKDTNAFQGTHAGNFTMNSYLSVAWNKTYP